MRTLAACRPAVDEPLREIDVDLHRRPAAQAKRRDARAGRQDIDLALDELQQRLDADRKHFELALPALFGQIAGAVIGIGRHRDVAVDRAGTKLAVRRDRARERDDLEQLALRVAIRIGEREQQAHGHRRASR